MPVASSALMPEKRAARIAAAPAVDPRIPRGAPLVPAASLGLAKLRPVATERPVPAALVADDDGVPVPAALVVGARILGAPGEKIDVRLAGVEDALAGVLVDDVAVDADDDAGAAVGTAVAAVLVLAFAFSPLSVAMVSG